MMSNEEMVQRVFERSDEYFRKKEKQRAIIKKGGTIMSVTGIIIAVSLAILSANTQNVVPPEEPSRIDVVGTMQSSTETTASTTSTIASSVYGSESNENNTETTSITTTIASTSATTTNTTRTAAVTTATTVETTAYEKATSVITTTPINTTASAVSETTAVTTTTSTTTYTTTTTEETTVEKGIILAIDTVEVTPGELAANNNRVDVYASIKNNPGFCGIASNLKYDERLTPIGSKQSDMLLSDDYNLIKPIGAADGYINMSFAIDSDSTKAYCEDDGRFWKMSYELPEDAAVGDEYVINFVAISHTEITTEYGHIPPTCVNGKIIVVETKTGDVCGDGLVDPSDATKVIAVYAATVSGAEVPEYDSALADINCDGAVDIKDAELILNYYAQNSAGLNPTWTLLMS